MIRRTPIKAATLFAVTALGISNAVAQEPTKNAHGNPDNLVCTLYSMIAQVSMTMHQASIPLSEARSESRKFTEGMSEAQIKYADDITIAAYNGPRHSNMAMRDSAVEEFSKERRAECLKMAGANR